MMSDVIDIIGLSHNEYMSKHVRALTAYLYIVVVRSDTARQVGPACQTSAPWMGE